MGFGCVDENVAIAIVRSDPLDTHFLMPAMSAAYWIGLHRKGQVLMYTGIFPPYPFRVFIRASEGLDTVNLAKHPLMRSSATSPSRT